MIYKAPLVGISFCILWALTHTGTRIPFCAPGHFSDESDFVAKLSNFCVEGLDAKDASEGHL